MTAEGERSPARDSAASASARSAAVSAALDGMDFSDVSSNPSAAEPGVTSEPGAPDAGAPGSDSSVTADQSTSTSTDAAAGQTDPTVSQTQFEAPKHWPQARRDEFAALPDNAKRILLAREKEFNTGLTKHAQENAEHRKRSEALTSVFTPEHRQQMQTAGIDEVGAIRQFLSLHDFYTRDPVGYVKHVISAAGIKPEQLFGGQPAQQQPAATQTQDEWVDPMVLELRGQLQALAKENNALKQSWTQFQQGAQQRENLTFQDEIASFRDAADSAGAALRPHFEAVKPILAHLIETDPELLALPDWKTQEKLQKAYDKAVWMVPEIRQQLIDAQVNQSVSAQTNQAAIDRAKAAATKKGSPGANGAVQPGHMSRSDAVAAALRGVGLS